MITMLLFLAILSLFVRSISAFIHTTACGTGTHLPSPLPVLFSSKFSKFSHSEPRMVALHATDNHREDAQSLNVDGDYVVQKLQVLDLINIWRLATKQFSPNCETVYDELLLSAQIFYLFTPKLLVPKFMGHEVIGLKHASTNELVGFVDLSLQQSCGSMDALKAMPLEMRRKKINRNQKQQEQVAVGGSSSVGTGGDLQPYLCNLLIAAPYRRQGLGRVLVRACVQEALQWNYNMINLHVESYSLPALSLYISEGFNILQRKTNGCLFMRKTFYR